MKQACWILAKPTEDSLLLLYSDNHDVLSDNTLFPLLWKKNAPTEGWLFLLYSYHYDVSSKTHCFYRYETKNESTEGWLLLFWKWQPQCKQRNPLHVSTASQHETSLLTRLLKIDCSYCTATTTMFPVITRTLFLLLQGKKQHTAGWLQRSCCTAIITM